MVTGGTRGIGEAICVALKDAGYTRRRRLCGNDEAAKEFTERTGIPAYKFDVGDYDAVQAGIAKIEEDLGPVDVWSTTPVSPATAPCTR
jgi:acetoacetyl-CoA reductase